MVGARILGLSLIQPGIYSLRLGRKIKSSTISPRQEAIPRARVVGTGSEGDTCSGLLQYSVPVRYTWPPLPIPEHVRFRAALCIVKT